MIDGKCYNKYVYMYIMFGSYYGCLFVCLLIVIAVDGGGVVIVIYFYANSIKYDDKMLFVVG